MLVAVELLELTRAVVNGRRVFAEPNGEEHQVCMQPLGCSPAVLKAVVLDAVTRASKQASPWGGLIETGARHRTCVDVGVEQFPLKEEMERPFTCGMVDLFPCAVC